MSIQSLAPIIARHPFCEGMSTPDLELLAGCAENVKFGPGEFLFRNGTEAHSSFLLRAGRVALVVHGAGVAETAEAGELLGWSWLHPPYRWHFDARAETAVRAIRLDGDCLRAKCEADSRFGFDLSKRILFQVTRRLERSRLHGLDVFRGAR